MYAVSAGVAAVTARLLGGRVYFTLQRGKVVAECTVRTAVCNGGITPYKVHTGHTLSYPTYIIGSDRQCTPLKTALQLTAAQRVRGTD